MKSPMNVFLKGALSRGFRRFLVSTVLKLVIGNLTHENHYLYFKHLKEDITLIRG